jgi:nucleotide-binding universal stress UspA family protein
MAAASSRSIIVVGVDGSLGSRVALQWAIGHAELVGASVHAVMAWQLPETHSYTSRDTEADARAVLNAALDDALSPDQRPLATALVTPGRPGHVLVEASSGAQLLVVGSHGHGDLVERLFGSVSHVPDPRMGLQWRVAAPGTQGRRHRDD